MTAKKSPRNTLSQLGIALVVWFVLFGLPYMACSGFFVSNPPKPEITYGEFLFKLEYEINGQRFTVEDILICKFDGYSYGFGDSEKYRRWKSYLASDKNEGAVLLLFDDTLGIKIYCGVGSARYYMGEPNYRGPNPARPNLGMSAAPGGYGTVPDELIEKYGIKIISWEFSDPIVNTFK